MYDDEIAFRVPREYKVRTKKLVGGLGSTITDVVRLATEHRNPYLDEPIAVHENKNAVLFVQYGGEAVEDYIKTINYLNLDSTEELRNAFVSFLDENSDEEILTILGEEKKSNQQKDDSDPKGSKAKYQDLDWNDLENVKA